MFDPAQKYEQQAQEQTEQLGGPLGMARNAAKTVEAIEKLKQEATKTPKKKQSKK